MASQEVLDLIHEALIAHGISAIRGQHDVRLELEDLRFEADIFDKEQIDTHRLVLEIYIFSPLLGTQPVIESFVGMGDTRQEATAQAFGKFLLGVFHVLIEGLAKHVCENMQAEIEFWRRNDASWKVYGGPVITQAAVQCTLNRAYPAFYAHLEKLFAANVRPGSHFVRIFLASYDGAVIGNEVLLDNETWPEGQELLVGQDWHHGDGYQALRQVILALPEDKPETLSRWAQLGKKILRR
ncbi:MAG: hypothetical protein E5W70_28385 [Mesorhizobium sp.]|uniref:DUF6348 family protein n=1 Tax=Mesorhizobium sp. TaxID=1871066 RepID=UPI0011F8D14D|nr:DUF6348 family protein [Mesorhizobium sp.]TIT18663.1 MAG: hypothetical protein E5W70_28385 [Mesorhizobium sp.]